MSATPKPKGLDLGALLPVADDAAGLCEIDPATGLMVCDLPPTPDQKTVPDTTHPEVTTARPERHNDHADA